MRPEEPRDADAVRDVHRRAFAGDAEAELVDRLRANGQAVVALVAEQQGRVAGHVLFSPVTIEGSAPDVLHLGLAPLAVLPGVQRQGIGTRLVRAGLKACRVLPSASVVVLGDPGYYGRFGFVPASRLGLRCEFEPADAFQVLELQPDALRACRGLVRYRPEFDGF